MTKLRLLLAACVALGLVAVGTAAAGPKSTTCTNGIIAGGTYGSVTVTGNCTFEDGATVTINGNLTVANGAILNDHAGSTAFVHVSRATRSSARARCWVWGRIPSRRGPGTTARSSTRT